MTTPQQTAITPATNQMYIEGYGTDAQVVAFAQRLKRSIPGGKKLTGSEVLALAQVSLATGLNPYIGEIWYIPDNGPMVGIKGLRRKADEQINQASGGQDYWHGFVRAVSPEEAGCPPENVKDCVAAFKYELRDTGSTRAYVKAIGELAAIYREAQEPDPVGKAKADIGSTPLWIGYGYCLKHEKTKMNKTRCAEKRAESDALKKRVSIPFGVMTDAYEDVSEAVSDDVIDLAALDETEDDPSERVDAHGQWAVETAAEKWNCTKEEAAKELWKKYPNNNSFYPKSDILAAITGEQ